MNRSLQSLFAACTAITLMGFFGCRPEETARPVPVYNRAGVHALMAPLRSAPQTFSVTAGTYTQVEGARGTVLSFNPNSFKDASGKTISGGQVEISLLEMYRPGEMIAQRATTVRNGSLLISGGQIYITATQDGQELRSGTYGIGFRQPAPASGPMNIYIGDRTMNPDSVVTWFEPANLAVGTWIDSNRNNNPYYQFDSVTGFNWINCDYFRSNPGPFTNITVSEPDDSYDPSNTSLWLVFPEINSVSYVNNYNSGARSFDLLPNYRVPLGMKFHLIQMTNKEGSWYYAEQRNMTTTSGHQISLSPVKVSIEDIRARLATL